MIFTCWYDFHKRCGWNVCMVLANLMIQLWAGTEREVWQNIVIYMNTWLHELRRDGATEKGKQKEGIKDVKGWDKLASSGIRAPLCKKKRFYSEILTDSVFYSVTPGEFKSYLTRKLFFLREKQADKFPFIYFNFEHILKELSSKEYSPSWQWNTFWPIEQIELRTSSLSGVKLENFSYYALSCFMVTAWITFQGNHAGV